MSSLRKTVDRLEQEARRVTASGVIALQRRADVDAVTTQDGKTMTRAEFSRRYPGGLIIRIVRQDVTPAR